MDGRYYSALAGLLQREEELCREIAENPIIALNYVWYLKREKELAFINVLRMNELPARTNYVDIVHAPELARTLLKLEVREVRRAVRWNGQRFHTQFEGYYLGGSPQQVYLGKL